MEREFKEGQIVFWDTTTCQIPVGHGVVRGIATTGAALIGRSIIVQTMGQDLVGEFYPYSCFAIFEVFLKDTPL